MKKLLSIILAGLMVLSLAACGGGGKAVTMTQVCDGDETMSATVTVGYKDGTTPSEAEADEAELINEEKNFSVEFYMVFDDSYESYKWAASESGEGYKEVKYSGYEGYMQLHDEFEYEVCLKLADEGDYQVYLFAYVAPGSDLIDTETTDIEAIFNQQEVQDTLNSVKYKGIENSSK